MSRRRPWAGFESDAISQYSARDFFGVDFLLSFIYPNLVTVLKIDVRLESDLSLIGFMLFTPLPTSFLPDVLLVTLCLYCVYEYTIVAFDRVALRRI